MQRNLGGFLVALAIAGLAGCRGAENLGEPAITDGLTLRYEVRGKSHCQVTFKAIDDRYFRAELDPPGCSIKPHRVPEEKLVVDAWLRLKNGRTPQWGEAIYLWLPESRRSLGRHGAMRVTRTGRWAGWDVYVVHGSFGVLVGTWYYDIETGFLVGFEKTYAGETTVVLKLL